MDNSFNRSRRTVHVFSPMHIIFSIVSSFFSSTIGLSVCAIGWFSLIADSVRPVFHCSAFFVCFNRRCRTVCLFVTRTIYGKLHDRTEVAVVGFALAAVGSGVLHDFYLGSNRWQRNARSDMDATTRSGQRCLSKQT